MEMTDPEILKTEKFGSRAEDFLRERLKEFKEKLCFGEGTCEDGEAFDEQCEIFPL